MGAVHIATAYKRSDGELPKKLEKPGDQTSLPLGQGLPVITPAMLPRLDPDQARQSA